MPLHAATTNTAQLTRKTVAAACASHGSAALLGLLLLCVVLLASPLRAQPVQPADAPAAGDEQVNGARERTAAGARKLLDADYPGALVDYRMADAVVRSPETKLGISRALEGLGRLVEARDEARSISMIPIADPPDPAQAKSREDAVALVYELEQRIARLRLVLPADAPSGMAVFLDEKPLLRMRSGDIEVDPGEHTLKASADGHQPYTKTFRMQPGGREAVLVTLVPIPATEPTIVVRPAPEIPTELVVGPATISGIGLTGAGLVVGIVAGAITLSRAPDLKRECHDGPSNTDCPLDYWDERADALTSAHVATGGFVAAGVGAALGLIGLLVIDPQPVREPGDQVPIAIRPLLGPGFIGVAGVF